MKMESGNVGERESKLLPGEYCAWERWRDVSYYITLPSSQTAII